MTAVASEALSFATTGEIDVGVLTLDLADRKIEVYYPAAAGAAKGRVNDVYLQTDPVPPMLAGMLRTMLVTSPLLLATLGSACGRTDVAVAPGAEQSLLAAVRDMSRGLAAIVAPSMTISTRRFCGSRTLSPVWTSNPCSPRPITEIAASGTPSFTSAAFTASSNAA